MGITSYVPALRDAREILTKEFEDMPGVVVTDNKLSITVAYRSTAVDKDMEKVEAAVTSVLADHPALARKDNRKEIEIRPDIDWNKGKAVAYLLETLDAPESTPLYIGGDASAEDAFRMCQEMQGVGILVSSEQHQTAANYFLKSPDELRAFLTLLTSILGGTSCAPSEGGMDTDELSTTDKSM
eukprot:GFYU01007914.1.p1 GENE.GFYU01007914.1~~GFYU01007914.1.p1  ORF type:complete len:184 (-),score=72.16 GFYU01007914.1:297-848(-)